MHMSSQYEQAPMPHGPSLERLVISPASSVEAPKTPRWYTPERMLGLFMATMFFTFIDQGAFASNGVKGAWPSKEEPHGHEGLVLDLGITPSQDGGLGACYTVGLVCAAIFFGAVSTLELVSDLRMVGTGLLVWCCGIVLTGLSPTFWVMVLARLLTGAGEASIMTLSAVFIDDSAPPGRKALWFGLLGLCQPVGVAAGFIGGGAIAGVLHWRKVFFIEAALAAPIAAFSLFAPVVQLRKAHPELHQPGSPGAFGVLAGCGGCVNLQQAGRSLAGGKDGRKQQQQGMRAALLTDGVELSSGGGAASGDGASAVAAAAAPAGVTATATLAGAGGAAAAGGPQAGAKGGPSHLAQPDGQGGALPSPDAAAAAVLADQRQQPWHVRLRRIARQQVWAVHEVHQSPCWVLNNYAALPIEFMLAGFSFWGPRAGRELHNKKPHEADLAFGLIAVIAGITGGLLGGVALDRCGATTKSGFRHQFVLCTIAASTIGCAFAFPKLPWEVFLLLLGLGITAISATGPASTMLSMITIPLQHRALSQAICIVSMRVLADLPAPPLIGGIQERIDNWRLTMSLTVISLVICIFLYAWGCLDSRFHRAATRDDGPASPVPPQPAAQQEGAQQAVPQPHGTASV